MFKKLLLGLLLLVAAQPSANSAAVVIGNEGVIQPVAAAGGCSEATAYLARLTTPTGTETTAFSNFICGMVTDGTWATTDVLYLIANTSGTNNHLVNAVGNYSNASVSTSPTCNSSNDTGCTGNGSTQFINTNHTPSSNSSTACSGSPCYALNDGTSFGCLTNNRTTTSNWNDWGVFQTSSKWIALGIIVSGATSFIGANDALWSTAVPTTTQGTWFDTRVDSSNVRLGRGIAGAYNDSLGSSASTSSVGLPGLNIYILGRNNDASLQAASADTIVIWGIGKYNSTGRTNIYSRINTLMTALGVSGC